MFTIFFNFWPPTYLCLHWLTIGLSPTYHYTEVRREFLIHFQKWFLNKVFIRIKIARKFKFYLKIIISGSKSVKKGQKMLKKATNWTYNAFSDFFFLSWLIWNNSIAKIWWKNIWCHITTLGVIFSHLVELMGPGLDGSFSELLTRANN